MALRSETDPDSLQQAAEKINQCLAPLGEVCRTPVSLSPDAVTQKLRYRQGRPARRLTRTLSRRLLALGLSTAVALGCLFAVTLVRPADRNLPQQINPMYYTEAQTTSDWPTQSSGSLDSQAEDAAPSRSEFHDDSASPAPELTFPASSSSGYEAIYDALDALKEAQRTANNPSSGILPPAASPDPSYPTQPGDEAPDTASEDADFVQSDGTYLYLITSGASPVVQILQADGLSPLSTIALPADCTQETLLVCGDTLVCIYTQIENGRPFTHALFYEIADRAHPRMIRHVSQEGTYASACLSENQVVLASSQDLCILQSLDRSEYSTLLPMVYDSLDGEQQLLSPACMDLFLQSSRLSSVCLSVLPASGAGEMHTRWVLGATADHLYITDHSIYLACETRGTSLPADPITLLMRYRCKNGLVQQGTAAVQGRLACQSALSEWNGTLRVMTICSGSPSSVRLSTFDYNMSAVGILSGIASGQEVKAACFDGSVICLALESASGGTILQLVDVTNPASPFLSGSLTLSSHTQALLSLGGQRLLLIGEQNAASSNVSLCLIDASSPTLPRITAQTALAYASCPAAVERALSYDTASGLLALPVHYVDSTKGLSGVYLFQAHENGLTLLSRITALAQNAQTGRYADDPDLVIARTVMTDGALYCFSPANLLRVRLQDFALDGTHWLDSTYFSDLETQNWIIDPLSDLAPLTAPRLP